jgi:hypothetical protein
MSDQKQKVLPVEPKPKEPREAKELGDEELDGVSGGLAGLGLAIPSVTGASSLPSRETSTCISQT